MPAIRRDSFYASRFWGWVDKTGECWLWSRALDQGGYGVAHVRVNGQLIRSAHRAAYVLEKGEIPDGLHIDHLCRVRHCVRPDHLEAVTPAENNKRIPRGEPMKNRMIRVDDETWEAAKRRAEAENKRFSAEMRKLIENYGKNYRGKGDA